MKVSIIIPAKNEADSLRTLLPKVKEVCPEAEVVLVDDGSTDGTGEVAKGLGAKVVNHNYSMGNGAAIKSGARNASGEVFLFMDADAQHNPSDIKRLLQGIEDGYEMVVGARSSSSQASMLRRFGNGVYNRLASWMTGHKVLDLTSGFRAVHADKFKEFIPLLPNGFSYPSTITMAFFRSAYTVLYIPIEAGKRQGKSHLSPFREGYRFLLVIFKIATLFSPLRVFVPASFTFFLTATGFYLYTYISNDRFTNMGALLFVTSSLLFFIGLVSEQITNLMYLGTKK